MGTPGFAAASLRELIKAGMDIVAVVTAPDRPSGRGLQVHQSEVKQMALAQGLPILQPEKLKDPEFVELLASYRADLFVVVAFRMLPQVIWAMPHRGCINLHASLLPSYRGAAPINWAIINGETRTGVTTFIIEKEIDTGSIILQESLEIAPDETAGELHDRLMELGAALMVKTVEAVRDNKVISVSQGIAKDAPTAPKIFRNDCAIQWNKPLSQVYNHIRGLSPYPGAWTLLHGKVLKVYAAKPIFGAAQGAVGALSLENNSLLVTVPDGCLELLVIQLEGKKRLTGEAFARGYDIQGACLGMG
ncbi:MAG: methionyl-tRNA formyltransferase [Bacteroidetes bacterium]|nr:methionyl-tRNA formyltransferase [Bacteroidota bacterium]